MYRIISFRDPASTGRSIAALYSSTVRKMFIAIARKLSPSAHHWIRCQTNGAQDLLVERESFITTITLNRPKANAMGKVLMQQFNEAMDQLEECSETRCVILRSSFPKVFSAGADLKERAGMTLEEAETTVTGLRNSLQRLARLPMPTIAAVEGVAYGGGLELAMAADFIVASKSATFRLPETSLGIIPGAGGTQRLPRLIGPSRALELIVTGQILDSPSAYQYSLVQHLVEAGKADEKAMTIAHQITKNAPLAVRAAKEALQRGMECSNMTDALEVERICYARTLPTKDRLEGLAAFREGRDPDYMGE